MPYRKGSITTFIKELKTIKALPGHTLFFRGHADEGYKAIPSIFRHINDDPAQDRYVINEDRLYKSMISLCPNDFESCRSAFDHLVKMQHYGLPTRLLDITANPLVALYFACANHASRGGRHGEVLVYHVPDDEIRFYSSDTVSVVSNLAKMSVSFDFITEKTKYLHEIKYEKPYFLDAIVNRHLTSVFCVKPKMDNPRIIRQSGAFLLFGMGSDKSQPADIPDAYQYKKSGNIHTIKISQNGKKTILSELAEVGISVATLFPEIDYVAKHLKSRPKGMI